MINKLYSQITKFVIKNYIFCSISVFAVCFVHIFILHAHALDISSCGRGDAETRLNNCSRLLSSKPLLAEDAAKIFDGKCWALNDLGRHQEALEACNRAISINPRYSFAYNNRGVALENLGRLDEALASFKHAVSLAPTRAIAVANMTRLTDFIKSRNDSESLSAATSKEQAYAVSDQSRKNPENQQAARPLRRIALIIGNTNYNYTAKLINPTNDADLIAAALKDVGFDKITVQKDLSQPQMLQALRDFSTSADTADWAVVYYSGHGIEFGGSNYLIPVEARLRSDKDIDLEGVDLGKVLSAIEGAKRLRLIVLDACRDNPFASQMRRTIVTRSVGRGLARIEPEAGTLIAYAAKHGEVAMDGSDKSGPYANALARRIRERPPLEIRRLFDLVRDDVMATTGRRQQPFSYGSVSGSEDFFFPTP